MAGKGKYERGEKTVLAATGEGLMPAIGARQGQGMGLTSRSEHDHTWLKSAWSLQFNDERMLCS